MWEIRKITPVYVVLLMNKLINIYNYYNSVHSKFLKLPSCTWITDYINKEYVETFKVTLYQTVFTYINYVEQMNNSHA